MRRTDRVNAARETFSIEFQTEIATMMDGGMVRPSALAVLRLTGRAEPGEKHVPRYLAEFEYRFNRRYDLTSIIPRLAWASVRTAPMPYSLLKLAEDHA
jgi:hypothetical protein